MMVVSMKLRLQRILPEYFTELSFELRESPRRRTVEIAIERDGSLVLVTPPHVPQDELERIVEQRRFWIYSKLIKKESYKAPTGTKTYLPGEGFYYLGRSYRLRLVDTAKTPLQLYQSRFELLRSALLPRGDAKGERSSASLSQQHRGQEHFIQWYRTHLPPHLEATINPLVNRIGASPRSLQVRELGYRWGSCSPQGDLYFHWRVAMLPRSMIEYIVVHELVHLIEPHHNRAFWDRVARILPDFDKRKHWLAENGAIYTL